MGYVPKDAKWYLADIVLEIAIEDDPRNVVHTNLVLIRADSPEEAYQKAIELGTSNEASWENIDGKRVTFRFRGLRDLNVILSRKLEHGVELSYCESIGMDEAAIQKWVTLKEELGVFSQIDPSTGPDYRSSDIVEKIYDEFPHLRRGGDKSKPN
jgi:Domain of unknown function (DUF4288)